MAEFFLEIDIIEDKNEGSMSDIGVPKGIVMSRPPKDAPTEAAVYLPRTHD
jgi:hypothetical protein